MAENNNEENEIQQEPSPQEEKLAEKERADANNAKNIRNAADVAIASGNPYAAAAGTVVKGLDKATGGKSTELLGKGLTKANKLAPGGKKVQNLSNKMAESGASDAAGKVASIKNAASGNGQPKSDVGEERLKKALANRGNNNLNQKSNSEKNRKKTKEERKKSREERKKKQNEDSNSSFSGSGKGESESKGKVKTIIKVIVVLIILPFILFILLLLLVIYLLFGSGLTQSVPAINVSTYGTDGFESVYEKGTDDYKKEEDYYKKIKEKSKVYADKYGEPFKENYLHASLIYIYYQVESVDIDEEELTPGVSPSVTPSSDNSMKIDYQRMSDYIDRIYDIMISSRTSEGIDVALNGKLYENFKNNQEFKKYYSTLLKEKTIDEILEGIFDLAEDIGDMDYTEETVITSETKVTQKEAEGSKEKTKTLTINEYLADSIYASTSNLSNGEVVKAYTVTYSTNIASQNKKLSISSNNATADNTLCSIKEGCSYDKDGKLVTGPGERSSKNTFFYNGKYYYKKPLTNEEISSLNKNINSVFGNVLVNSDGTYPTLDWSKLGGLGDGDYKTILKNAYGDLKYKNIGENSYILDGSYGDKQVKTDVIFYDQKDYKGSTFCGIKGYTIGGSGCGVTAMAIVASTYENNKKYDPVYMNSEATKKGMCGGGNTGTKQAFFGKEASTMKYKYVGGAKSNKSLLNLVLKHLSQGHLVVARMGSGHFTSGGHYIVLGGVDPQTKKVYVYDPNNRSNKGYRKTGNGWYSFNDIIVKEAYNFYIIWKG